MIKKEKPAMARKTLLIVAAIMALSLFAFAATKPDFSGTWAMDRERSFGLPPDMNQTLVVSQKADQIELETKLIQPNNERSVKDTYILDGKEHEFTPPPPPPHPPPPRHKNGHKGSGGHGGGVT